MTATVALLAVPKAAWDFIASAMTESGYDNHFVTSDDNGAATVALDMHGIALLPDGDSDQFINSGHLSDLMVQSNEEAFYAGYRAHRDGIPLDRAWGDYEPSEDILELQNNL